MSQNNRIIMPPNPTAVKDPAPAENDQRDAAEQPESADQPTRADQPKRGRRPKGVTPTSADQQPTAPTSSADQDESDPFGVADSFQFRDAPTTSIGGADE
jgi:hypothetical protein